MVVLPIELAFFATDQTASWVAFNLTSSFVFAIDILMNFYSGTLMKPHKPNWNKMIEHDE